MTSLKPILSNFIKEAKAQTSVGDYGPTFSIPPADLSISSTRFVGLTIFLIVPVIVLVLSIRHGLSLLKNKNFTLYHAIYKSFLRVIKLLILGSIYLLIASVIIAIISNTGDAYFWYFDLYGTSMLPLYYFCSFFIATGLGYLAISFKDKRLLLIALAYIFILPSIIMFILLIVLNAVPAWRKNLPPDAKFGKSQELQN